MSIPHRHINLVGKIKKRVRSLFITYHHIICITIPGLGGTITSGSLVEVVSNNILCGVVGVWYVFSIAMECEWMVVLYLIMCLPTG